MHIKNTIFYFLLTIILPAFVFAQDSKIPDYSKTKRSDIPVEFTWKNEDIYSSVEEWKKDKEKVTSLINKIDEKRETWNKTSKNLLEFYQYIEEISKISAKLASYVANLSDVDLGNSTYKTMMGEIQPLFVELGSKLAFMNEDILKMNSETLDKFYAEEPKLQNYKFQIDAILRTKAHILPEEQEQLVSLTSLFSGVPADAAGTLNNVEIPAPEITLSTGEKITLNATTYQARRSEKNPEDRMLVAKTYWENRSKYVKTLASLFNGSVKADLFYAKAYKYNSCLESTLDANNIDTSVYMQLIRTIKGNLSPMFRIAKIKKELLGLDKFRYEDFFASAVKKIDRSYSFDEAKELVIKSLQPLGTDYVNVIKTAFTNRWIDVYPNLDKQYGAYSRGVYGIHPFVKMNFTGKFDDVSTINHELGHSMHSYLSERNQTYNNFQYPIFLAEIASTFNENLLVEYMLKNEKDDLFKLYLLDGYLDRIRSTIYRQTMFAEFELAMHKRVESGNSLTADWLNKKYLQLAREYYGHDKGIVEVGEHYKNEWSGVPHFFRNFYVYQYATGMIASLALSNHVLNGGDKELQNYLSFLKSGGSNYPLEILKKAGVDMTTPKPFDDAVVMINKLVDEMEGLIKKLKAEGKL